MCKPDIPETPVQQISATPPPPEEYAEEIGTVKDERDKSGAKNKKLGTASLKINLNAGGVTTPNGSKTSTGNGLSIPK